MAEQQQKVYTKITVYLKSTETQHGQNFITLTSLISDKALINIINNSKEGYFNIYVETKGEKQNDKTESFIERYDSDI